MKKPELTKAFDQVIAGPPGTKAIFKTKTENEARSLQNRIRQELKRYIKVVPDEDGLLYVERKKGKDFYQVTLERVKPFKLIEVIYPKGE